MNQETGNPEITKFPVNSEQAMIDLGVLIGAKAATGAVIFLSGELGSGKTTLTKGIARGLDIKESITSPTFQLCKSYRGREVLYHLDLYRLKSPAELKVLDLDELLDEGVTVIEWGDLLWERLCDRCILIQIEMTDDPARRLVGITTKEPRFIPLVEAVYHADFGD
jgi:tRNA threonylcarbamoyladenosine biosynthesis protein TsaE